MDGVGADPRAEEGRAERRRTIAKSLAVLVTTVGLLCIPCGIDTLLSESTRHGRGHWDTYLREAGKLRREARVFFQKVPENVLRQFLDVSADVVEADQGAPCALWGD